MNDLNKGKAEKLKEFLSRFANIVQYYVEMFWSKQNFSSRLADKQITDKVVNKFGLTARLSQLAAKHAKEMVNSQRTRSKRKRKMPCFRNISINLDSRFFTLTEFDGHFDYALRLSSGIPSIIVPLSNTRHTLRFLKQGWILGNSIRIGIKDNKIFIDLIFEKPKPALKQVGELLGVDTGYRSLLATSGRQLIGTEIKDKIKRAGKRRKSFHHYVETEANRLLKTLNLDNIKIVVLEDLKNLKKDKRGKFSRYVNRLLSFWHYARVIQRLKQLCEEKGVRMIFKSPWKTSQRCPLCGKIDKRNRSADRFRCIYCGFEENADIVGAMNLKALGLAGVYSLRLLQSQLGYLSIN